MPELTSVNVHEAKSQLSKLLARVEQGEEIIISRAGHPVAKLVPVEKPRRIFGLLKGQIWIADNFDDPMPEFEDAFYNGEVFPPDEEEAA